MTRYDFKSDSWIVYVTYDSETRELSIHTKTKIYTLVDVPQEVYDQFSSAGSKGKYFNEHLKSNYISDLFK